MAINWQFYHWHLEPSAVCTLKCPRCPRTEHPDTPWLNKNMTLSFVKKFFTEDMLKNNVQRVTMCGDVGDPISAGISKQSIQRFIFLQSPTAVTRSLNGGLNSEVFSTSMTLLISA